MRIWQRRMLGILAVGGGAVGVVVCLAMFARQMGPLSYFLILFGSAIYGWGIWCGVKLLEAAPGASGSNRWFWAIQIPVLQSPVIGYVFSSGALLDIYAQANPLKFGFNWLVGSQFNYELLQPGKPLVVGVNVFALAAFLVLSSARRTELRRTQSADT